ncbi:MAG: hypothetical protein IJ298_00800 [Ruminococcus sp.]|nr:hypothetical protein [Ruminococcus sp.]
MTGKNRIAFCSSQRGYLQIVSLLIAVLVLCALLCGCSDEPTDSTKPYYGEPSTLYNATSADLYCMEITRYSGPFVEDGTNEPVEDVAAILVENGSKQFLDRATVTYDVGGKTATFVVTGLPAGGKAWVLESNRMQLEEQLEFEFLDCESSFRKDAVTDTKLLDVSAVDNLITVKNVSDDTLNNVCIYYKNVNSDGNYLGGISYMIAFDTLDANESTEKASAHYTDNSRIVRYSYQTE